MNRKLRITTVCGMGLGSSLLVEMNAKKIMEALNIDAELSHLNIASFMQDEWDYVIVGEDIVNVITVDESKLITIRNIASYDELFEKVKLKLNIK